uniref:Uncharacterized protein LOC108047841 n=1 Tax=Drosophila rhopaloa TaxID=1041015 RepID=A0A6P4FDU4_DRORH
MLYIAYSKSSSLADLCAFTCQMEWSSVVTANSRRMWKTETRDSQRPTNLWVGDTRLKIEFKRPVQPGDQPERHRNPGNCNCNRFPCEKLSEGCCCCRCCGACGPKE